MQYCGFLKVSAKRLFNPLQIGHACFRIVILNNPRVYQANSNSSRNKFWMKQKIMGGKIAFFFHPQKWSALLSIAALKI